MTFIYFNGKISRVALGVRLVVGQQTLDLYAEVRILDPQPGRFDHESPLSTYTPRAYPWGVAFISKPLPPPLQVGWKMMCLRRGAPQTHHFPACSPRPLGGGAGGGGKFQ